MALESWRVLLAALVDTMLQRVDVTDGPRVEQIFDE